jgi:protein gp37
MPSKIGWCSDTVNVFSGCDGGCHYCYARRMSNRLANIPGTVYHDLASSGLDPFTPTFHENVYDAVLQKIPRWCKPRRIFIGSMGEICSIFRVRNHVGKLLDVSMTTEEVLRAVIGLFRDTQHTALMLTKWPDRLPTTRNFFYPSNMQMGVSVTCNADAHRVGSLLARLHPTTYCWASVEPMLDPHFNPAHLNGLDWVVIGAQTGPGSQRVSSALKNARVDAAQRICAHCREQGIRLRPAYPWPQDIFKGGAS